MTDLKCVRKPVRPASLPIVPTATGQRSYNAPKHAVTVPVRRLSPPAIATKLSICLPRESSVLSCGYTRRLQGDRRTFRGRRGFVHRWWPAICKPRFIDRVRAVAHEHRGVRNLERAPPGTRTGNPSRSRSHSRGAFTHCHQPDCAELAPWRLRRCQRP